MNGLALLFKSICNGKNVETIIKHMPKAEQLATKVTTNTTQRPLLKATKIYEATATPRERIALALQDKDLVSQINNPQGFYTTIRNKIYETIRGGSKQIYTSRPNYNPKEFHTTLFKKQNGFFGKVENSWVYRYPENFDATKPIVDRLSLNVHQDKELIEKLDIYLSKNCPNARYKCVGAGSMAWNSRHDAITIYFPEKVSPKIEQDIAKIIQPHIRQSDNAIMLGRKVSDGIYEVEEPTFSTIKPLLIKAKLLNLDPEFYEWLGKPDFELGGGLYTLKNGQIIVHTSPAAVEALRQMLDKFSNILHCS